MARKNILVVDYNNLTVSERVNALREAREAGEQSASDDTEPTSCSCVSGHHTQTVECVDPYPRRPAIAVPADYITQVLEPAFQDGEIDQEQLRARSEEIADDPRVAAFVTAANKRYREICDDLNAQHEQDELDDLDAGAAQVDEWGRQK